jgi:hypothetical protein
MIAANPCIFAELSGHSKRPANEHIALSGAVGNSIIRKKAIRRVAGRFARHRALPPRLANPLTRFRDMHDENTISSF